jgi:outer membrane protein OmpA-like peptidoglycan-associated protein
VTAYSKGLKEIGAGLIKECGRELEIPIEMGKIQNGHSHPVKIKSNLDNAAFRPQQRRGFNFGFAFIILLFMVFVGYQIYGSFMDNSAFWKPKEFVSQENYQVLEEQKEAFKTEIESGNKAEKDQAADEFALQEGSEAGITAEASPDIESDNDGEIRELENPKIDSAETQPTGFITDQKSIIQFEHNSNELPPKAYATLDSVVKFTLQRPDLKITVEGYTDSHGDPVYNRQLSKYRADMVKNYLIGHGISPANIIAIGRGSKNPIKSNKTFEGRKQNRRVEILVKKIH